MAAQDDNFYNKVLIDFFEKNPKYNNILKRKIMNEYIKTLIEANKDAVSNIAVLETTVRDYPVIDEKTKANFGNLCILLNGYRNIAKATECLLINENVLKSDDGGFYQKIDEKDTIVPPSTEGKEGSDFDKDNNNREK